LNETEPWRTIKTDKEATAQSLGIAVQFVAAIADMIYPFLPDSSIRIRKVIGRRGPPEWLRRSESVVKSGTRVRPLEPLYHKVSAEELRRKLTSIRSADRLETEN
ncbi:MAG TPA: hypothetical protein VE177_07670, partial [Candidatus Binatus sp.]|nr:hypothetical protein [Candidatus Binatus sp.]